MVLDSVAAIYSANENDRAEVRGFLSALARWAYEGDRSVLLLADPPKSGSDYSGSTDWLAGVRALWTLGPRRGFIHAPRGAGHQLQVLPPIGTSSGRGRVHNRPQARRRRDAKPNIHYEAIVGNVTAPAVAERLIDCDAIFLAADSWGLKLPLALVLPPPSVHPMPLGADAASGLVRDGRFAADQAESEFNGFLPSCMGDASV